MGGDMNVGLGLIIFFVSLVALVAEFILYLIFGFGASFSGDISTLEGTAFLFVGLMVLTGATGILYPLFAVFGTLTKKKSFFNKAFLIILGIIFIGYFFILPNSVKKAKTPIISPQFKAEKTVNTEVVKKAVEQQPDIEGQYIKQFLLLKGVTVFDGYGKYDMLGYSATKKAIKGNIKNIGDKALSFIQITIYFLDLNGSRIGEKAITVLSTKSIVDASPAFKPNYSKDFGYIIEEDAPSDWAGKVEVEVSKISFD
jgi:hypothetical protein